MTYVPLQGQCPVCHAINCTPATTSSNEKLLEESLFNLRIEFDGCSNVLNQTEYRVEALEAELECEEKRFNDLFDQFAEIVKQRDVLMSLLIIVIHLVPDETLQREAITYIEKIRSMHD